MNSEEALTLIKKALENVEAGLAEKIHTRTNLVDDDILDSLEVMNFLFELENLHGKNIEEIDEEFSDFRVSKLIEILSS